MKLKCVPMRYETFLFLREGLGFRAGRVNRPPYSEVLAREPRLLVSDESQCARSQDGGEVLRNAAILLRTVMVIAHRLTMLSRTASRRWRTDRSRSAGAMAN